MAELPVEGQTYEFATKNLHPYPVLSLHCHILKLERIVKNSLSGGYTLGIPSQVDSFPEIKTKTRRKSKPMNKMNT